MSALHVHFACALIPQRAWPEPPYCSRRDVRSLDISAERSTTLHDKEDWHEILQLRLRRAQLLIPVTRAGPILERMLSAVCRRKSACCGWTKSRPGCWRARV